MVFLPPPLLDYFAQAVALFSCHAFDITEARWQVVLAYSGRPQAREHPATPLAAERATWNLICKGRRGGIRGDGADMDWMESTPLNAGVIPKQMNSPPGPSLLPSPSY